MNLKQNFIIYIGVVTSYILHGKTRRMLLLTNTITLTKGTSHGWYSFTCSEQTSIESEMKTNYVCTSDYYFFGFGDKAI